MQPSRTLQALRASIDEAALAEDAAAAARLEAEGQRLDGLAASLQALEGRQAGLQVRSVAAAAAPSSTAQLMRRPFGCIFNAPHLSAVIKPLMCLILLHSSRCTHGAPILTIAALPARPRCADRRQ